MPSDNEQPFIRQLAITSPQEWQRLTDWYRTRRLDLAPMPTSDDGIATYSPTPSSSSEQDV